MSVPILEDLEARGLIQDSTDREALSVRLEERPITLYAGFDPTGDSLHIGHLVPLLLLRRFQIFGHRPIALAGGGTGMIGDPSGKSKERNLLGEAALEANVVAIKVQLESFLDFSAGETQARLVNNRSWIAPMSTIEFLRDVGKHITVNTMLAKESVKARVSSEVGISFTEFSYMLLQAFDFSWLFEHENCEMQVGGSDQWGNITAGIDLIRRQHGAGAFGLTVPLMTRSDGQKFGKSGGENVWLSADKTPPYRFYQYFIQTDDRDVERFLKQLTFLSIDEIEDLVSTHQEHPDRRVAQERLAGAVTALVHGAAEAEAAREASAILFSKSEGLPSERALVAVAGEVPTTEGLALPDSAVGLFTETGLASSKSDARRGLDAGEFWVNGERCTQDGQFDRDALLYGRFLLLRRGKKRHHLVIADV